MKFVLDIDPENLIRKINIGNNSLNCDDLAAFFLDAFVDAMLDALEKKYPEFSLDKSVLGDKLIDWCKHNPTAIPDALKDKISEALERVKAVKPRDFVSTVDKISQLIHNPAKNSDLFDGANIEAYVGKDRKGKKVSVYLSLDISDLHNISFSDNSVLSPQTRAVHDAVISNYCAGNIYITAEMVYSVFNGGKPIEHLPKGFKTFFNEAMTKLMYTRITIDNAEEATAFKCDYIQHKGHVVDMTYTRAIINGYERECWKILDKPPLLRYAEARGQIARCGIEQLNTGLSVTPKNIVLTQYLLDRVMVLKSEIQRAAKSRFPEEINPVIRYDTLYSYLQLDAPNENAMKQAKSKVRKDVKAILDAWTADGFIAGYGEVVDGKEITGIKIDAASN